MKELEKAEDYFPYIGHNLDNKDPHTHGSLWKLVVGNLFSHSDIVREEDRITLNHRGANAASLFAQVIVQGMKAQQQIAADPDAVEAIVPRHRTLYDYCIHMPVHTELISHEVMLMAGHNLFIAKYSEVLRNYGAIVFVRNDTFLERKNYPRVFLSQHRYIKEVLPAYLKQEMIDRPGGTKIKRNLILYPGQEKDPVTHVRNGGRTKTGQLRKLNPIFFEKFAKITRGNPTKFFVTPVCISFSKYPDAPYLVHSSPYKGVLKALRYLHEQNFIYRHYNEFSQKRHEARLDVFINYGRPKPFRGEDFKSMRDLFEFVNELRDDIGRLECIFPLTLLFQAMKDDAELPVDEFASRARRLYDYYLSRGIVMEKVSSAPGQMMPVADLIDASIRTINANPTFHIQGLERDHFLSLKGGRLYSHDARLQSWYVNTLAHLHGNVKADDE